jgi:hypothetical protein
MFKLSLDCKYGKSLTKSLFVFRDAEEDFLKLYAGKDKMFLEVKNSLKKLKKSENECHIVLEFPDYVDVREFIMELGDILKIVHRNISHSGGVADQEDELVLHAGSMKHQEYEEWYREDFYHDFDSDYKSYLLEE